MRWVVLTDGQEDLLRQVAAAAKRYKVDIVLVQDFVHVLEYLWSAAYALHPHDAEEREGWVMDRASAILQGRAKDVAVGLRRAATRKQLSQSARKPVDKAADYIDNNQERLRYDQALVHGLPIATGVIEGACRHLVKDRMDITGAHWGLQRAEAILNLRSLKISGDLPAYLAFHFAQTQTPLPGAADSSRRRRGRVKWAVQQAHKVPRKPTLTLRFLVARRRYKGAAPISISRCGFMRLCLFRHGARDRRGP